MSEYTGAHLKVVSVMFRKRITGAHHKQRQTIKGWCSPYEGDILDAAIDDLITDGMIHEKGRGTIQLSSLQAGENFLKRHDTDGEYTWFY